MTQLWVLGAADPEMEMIEKVLLASGEHFILAVDADGKRVHAGNAYACAPINADVIPWGGRIYFVECSPAGDWPRTPDGCFTMRLIAHEEYSYTDTSDIPSDAYVTCHLIDHHRPGDFGHGRPPEDFFRASSIGQVVAELARLDRLDVRCWTYHRALAVDKCGTLRVSRHADKAFRDVQVIAGSPRAPVAAYIPDDLLMTAAADHCLGAAYRRECPGVDPNALTRWRAESRAKFQQRSVEAVLADIEATTVGLRWASVLVLRYTLGSHCGGSDCGCREGGYGYGGSTSVGTGDCYCDCDGCAVGESAITVADMRREPPWPELPEAACRIGAGYISGPLDCPNGRKKITCSGTADQVRAFIEHWAPTEGLVDIYGDPARGFAGGYLK
jgi:hypothetical protein